MKVKNCASDFMINSIRVRTSFYECDHTQITHCKILAEISQNRELNVTKHLGRNELMNLLIFQNSWCYNVKELLGFLGFYEAWLSQSVSNIIRLLF